MACVHGNIHTNTSLPLMIQCFLLLGLQLQVLPLNARKSISYCLTERHSKIWARLNTRSKVYGKISQRILLTYAITQILGNGWRMRTTTPAVDTRPSFFAFRPIRRASVVANILREKLGSGDEAMAYLAAAAPTPLLRKDGRVIELP